MPEAYPTYRTGTSQDLMTVISRAESGRAKKAGTKFPSKGGKNRFWMEPLLNLVGIGIWRLLEMLPKRLVTRVHELLFTSLANPLHCSYDEGEKFAAAKELVKSVEEEKGEPPALVALISHGPTSGELANMNFELVRHAMWVLDRLREKGGRPRLLVAVDGFALDTVSMTVEALYAGFMGYYHFGLDRLALARRALSRRLLRRAAWYHLPFRLMRFLKNGGEVGMALGGGVNTTSRVLYGVKEWLGDQIRRSLLRRDPAKVADKLEKNEDYRRHIAGSSLSKVPSVWRRIEEWGMSAMVDFGGNGMSSAETGRLSPAAERTLRVCLEALGYSPARITQALMEFADEIKRETPWRARFFSVLDRRVLRSGRPLVFIPLVHRADGSGIDVGTAWAWTGRKGTRVLARSADGRQWQGSVAGFARIFVTGNYW